MITINVPNADHCRRNPEYRARLWRLREALEQEFGFGAVAVVLHDPNVINYIPVLVECESEDDYSRVREILESVL